MSRLLSHAALVAGLAVAFSLVQVPAAHAYLDPGTGSMIFQAVIAAAMAAGLTLRLFWRRITGFFRSDVSQEEPDREPQDAE